MFYHTHSLLITDRLLLEVWIRLSKFGILSDNTNIHIQLEYLQIDQVSYKNDEDIEEMIDHKLVALIVDCASEIIFNESFEVSTYTS